jgi:hypothetical protein
MNYVADAVEIVQTHQCLAADFAHYWYRNTPVVILFY